MVSAPCSAPGLLSLHLTLGSLHVCSALSLRPPSHEAQVALVEGQGQKGQLEATGLVRKSWHLEVGVGYRTVGTDQASSGVAGHA